MIFPRRKELLWCAIVAAPAVSLAQEDSYDCVFEARSTIELQSSEDGIIDAVLVERGQRVAKGEVVAQLDAEQEQLATERARVRAQSETGVEAARAQSEYRRKEAERLEDLRKTDSIPERELATARVESRLADISVQTAATEHDIAKIEYEQAKSRLERRSIRSPVKGVIVDVTMFPGEYVHEQAKVMTIAEIDPLHVEAFLPVSLYGAVRAGTPAEVQAEEPIGGTYNAKVSVVDKVFDAASRTFRVRLVLPNPDYDLPAGLRCKLKFLPEQSDAAP